MVCRSMFALPSSRHRASSQWKPGGSDCKTQKRNDGTSAAVLPNETFIRVEIQDSGRGLEVAEIIKKEFPSVQVLIVSQHDSRGFQWAALAAGVSGYVNKSNVGQRAET